VETLNQQGVLANLTVALGVLERLHRMARADAEISIAQIHAQAQVAIEAERARCSASLGQTQEHWQQLRALEREHIERVQQLATAEQSKALAAVEETAEDNAQIADQLDELRQLRATRRHPSEPSAWDRIQPLLEQVAPLVVPKLLSLIEGTPPPAHGSLPGDGT